MKNTATYADVVKALETFKTAMDTDPKLEGLFAKKLATAVDALTLKDGVTKDMSQAYTHAEKKWAMNVLDDEKEGCTRGNKLAKIREYVLESTSYKRHVKDPDTKAKVEKWIDEKFPGMESEPE
jgi:hypothetical protein